MRENVLRSTQRGALRLSRPVGARPEVSRRSRPRRSASPRAGGTARPVPSQRGRRLRLQGASWGAHGAAPTHACPGRPRPLRSPPPGAAARSHTAALSPSRTPARGRPGCSSQLFVRFGSFMASPGSGFWPFGTEEGSAAAESPGTGRAAPSGRDRPEPTRRNRGVRRRPRSGGTGAVGAVPGKGETPARPADPPLRSVLQPEPGARWHRSSPEASATSCAVRAGPRGAGAQPRGGEGGRGPRR